VTGRRVNLSHEGEGWFTGSGDLGGIIESVIPSNSPAWHVVRFDAPLELQESGAATPSGFILRRYSHCVIRSRGQGTDINADAPVSVHVRLVPPGSEPPRRSADVVDMPIRVWARCVVQVGDPGRQRKL
jgi:hypothetical protein